MPSHVLNTRPAYQSEHLTKLIEENKGVVFHLPIIETQPIAFHPIKSNDFDYFIFLSSNAVRFFFQKNTPIDSNQSMIAIGSATEQSLIAHGYRHVLCPNDFCSEGIAAMPALQNIRGKKIAIISGKNPKPLLKSILEKRGANIHAIFCYERKPVSHHMQTVFPALEKHKIDVVISTSLDSFFYLMTLFSEPTHRTWLLQKKLCVINDAMKMEALKAGFHCVIQAENATDEALICAINSPPL